MKTYTELEQRVVALWKKAKKRYPDKELLEGFEPALTSDILGITEIILEEERKEEAKWWRHEQEKLLDGFAHPKDCPTCSKNNTYDEDTNHTRKDRGIVRERPVAK